ncbi:MAG: lipopolysaccharide biosynthesis protein [Syntrophobacteraceae bacterium]
MVFRSPGIVALLRNGHTIGLAIQSLYRTIHKKLLGQGFLRNVGALTVANITRIPVSLLQAIIVARWLGPELYGITTLIMAYPNVLFTFFDAKCSDACVKYMSEFHALQDRERILAVCKLGYMIDLGIASLAFVSVLITADWAANRFVHDSGAAWLVIAFASGFFPKALMGTSTAVLTTLGRFSLLAWLNTVTTFLQSALVVLLVYGGLQVTGVIWANLAAAVLTGMVYGIAGWIIVRKEWNATPFSGSLRSLKGKGREIARFLVFTDVTSLLAIVPKQLDILVLGYFRAPGEVGFYKIAKNLTSVFGYLVGPLQSVTYPEIARLWGLGDKQAIRNRVRHLIVKVGLPLGFLALMGIPLIPFIIAPVFGDNYQAAVLPTQILMAGGAIWVAFFWLRPLMLAYNKVNVFAISNLACVFLMTPILPYLALHEGYIAVAIWSLVYNLLGYLIIMLIHGVNKNIQFVSYILGNKKTE